MSGKIYIKPIVICFLLMQGCAGDSARPLQETERLLHSYPLAEAAIGAPESAQPAPWRVGQWAAYRIIDGHGESYHLKYALVAEAVCGYWVEMDLQGYHGRTTQKLCYRSMPPATQRDGTQAAKSLVTMMVTRIDDGKPVVADFSNREHKYARALFNELGRAGIVNFYTGLDLAQEDVAVPAGRFLLAFRYRGIVDFAYYHGDATVWTHPEVPVTGVVRLVGEAGYVAELLAYGQGGAVSALPPAP